MKVNEDLLHTIIHVVLVVLLVIAVYAFIKAFGGYAVQAAAVGATTQDLATAINDINQCINERKPDPCTDEIEVTASLPREDVKDSLDPSIGSDPMWIIFHEICVGDCPGPGCGAGNNQVPAVCECQSLWDSGIWPPDKCENDLCWGLIENSAPERSLIDKEAIDRLEPFYIIDPCYALVIVREDPLQRGKIQVCFEEPLEGPGDYNFCYGGDGCWGFSDSDWPHDDKGAFGNSGSPSRRCSDLE